MTCVHIQGYLLNRLLKAVILLNFANASVKS